MEHLRCLTKELQFESDSKPTFSFWIFGTVTGVTGVVLFAIVCVIFIFAHPKIRQKAYSYFWTTHSLYILLYILCFVHGLAKLTGVLFDLFLFISVIHDIDCDFVSNCDSVSHCDSVSYSDSVSHCDSVSYCDSVSQCDSVSHSDSVSYSDSVSHSDSVSQCDSVSHSDSVSHCDSVSHSDSVTHYDSVSYSDSVSGATILDVFYRSGSCFYFG